MNPTNPQPHRLYRSERHRIIAGVAGGFGEYFSIDPTLIRLAFVLVTLIGGFGIVLYLLAWILIPTKSNPAETFEQRAEEMAEEVHEAWDGERSKARVGIFLVILGLLFLFANFGFYDVDFIGKLWPLFLVALGWSLLMKRR